MSTETKYRKTEKIKLDRYIFSISCPQIHNWKKFTIAKPETMAEISKEITDTIQKILTLTRIYYLKIISIKVNSI